MKLNIQWFIEQNKDWESKLQEQPYAITISRDRMLGRNLVMFKYSQIESDFTNPLVRECRGIVLDEDTNEVISYAFDKFGNAGESYVPTLDPASMKSTVKIDGSIIKIVRYGDDLLISTNGTIDAFKAPIAEQIGCSFKSFGEIVQSVLDAKYEKYGIDKHVFKEGYTYIFEMVSPFTRVVTPFKETNLYLIGCRCNTTYNEIFFKDVSLSKYFDMPDILDFSSIDACLEYASTLDWQNEGYVVMDKNFNRVKCKNKAWLACHHLKGNGVMSYSRAVDLVRLNEVDEVLSYYPEFSSALLEVKDRYLKKVDAINSAKLELDSFIRQHGWDRQPWWIESGGQKRKEIAIWIMKNFPVPGIAFGLIDKKITSIDEWFKQQPSDKLVQMLGFKADPE